MNSHFIKKNKITKFFLIHFSFKERNLLLNLNTYIQREEFFLKAILKGK